MASAARRRLVPEVVQTSAMDCGPACLAAMLRGFGIEASYGRLREACQTDVDGTSIDTLEEICGQLGLSAVQVLIPLDHVLLQEADALPAIAVTRLPAGDNHFVVAWSEALGRVQVMDPGSGRRWPSRAAFLDQLYVHEMDLPAEAWREWAGSDDLTRPLARRLRALGDKSPAARIARALEDPGFQAIATLDAAVRMVQAVVDADGLAPGAHALSLLDALLADAATIPQAYWSARAGEDGETVRARGAVMVHASGRKADAEAPKSPELRAALAEPRARPFRALFAALGANGKSSVAVLALGLLLSALGTVFEAALFRAVYDIGRELAIWPQRLFALLALLTALSALALIEVPLRAGVQRLGRGIELRLRIGFLEKLPRLGLAYLRSRPRSDMAERSHALHQLRELPGLGARVLRLCCEMLVTALALCWFAPRSSPLVLLLLLCALLPPFLVQPLLGERELRVRTHAGGLSRFYLDALLGAIPARTHGIERTLRREHEALLAEWMRAAFSERRVAVTVAIVQATLSLLVAIALVCAFVDREAQPGATLLLAYWTLSIPWLGHELTGVLRALPGQRNLTLRLLEPLAALDDEVEPKASNARGGVSLSLHGLSVYAAGHQLLSNIDLEIGAGEHVAIVGRSGAGKSTLLGLLLGWVRPSEGQIRIDGSDADAGSIAGLREHTAWVDPAVHLWNESLADNLTYGAPGSDVAALVGAADLESVLARLPEGLGTRLGEGGTMVSGGEGQRVRLARGFARAGARLALLDEPCRGLDHDARRKRLLDARAHFRHATLLCVTHDVADAATFPRLLVIEEGQIVEDGTPAELAQKADSRYRAMLAEEASAARAWSRWQRLVLAQGKLSLSAQEAE